MSQKTMSQIKRAHIESSLNLATQVMSEMGRRGTHSHEVAQGYRFTSTEILAWVVQRLVNIYVKPELTSENFQMADAEIDYIRSRWFDVFHPIDADLLELVECYPFTPVEPAEERQRIRERFIKWGEKHFPLIAKIDAA